MKFTTIIVFLIPVVVARHHHRTLLATILKSKGNFYSKLNQHVQNVVNNLFDTLNLEPTFQNKSRIKSLLSMHYNLKSVAEKNYDAYEKMNHIAKTDNGNKTWNKVELFELIEEILNDESFAGPDTVIENKFTRKHTKLKTENITTTSAFRDSKEFNEFIKDFMEKIDKLSLKDIQIEPPVVSKPPLLRTFEKENNFTEYNLEIWEPPSVIEFDYFNGTETRRIYRGKKTRIKSFPFVASIHLLGTFACAGSIISRDLIISAASCLQLLYNNRFYRENPRSIYVRLGSDYYARGGEKIDIIETYFHPSYDPKTLKNNLVILRLQKLIKFMRNQPKIRRILYDRTMGHLPANTDGITIVGWGSRKRSQIIDQFQKLMVAELDFYHIDECAEIYSRRYVTNLHFCGGFISTGGGACNKDLGGPGVVAGKLMGVISFGAPVCGTVDAPTVFTKLGFYAKWIDSILRLRPPVKGVRTTARSIIRTRHVFYSKKITRTPVTPVTHIATYRAREKSEVIALKDVLHQLSQFNSSVLQDLLYGDPDNEYLDVFKSTKKIDVIQHPLVNKSLFMMPEIHTFQTTQDYTTIILTTSSTTLPPPNTGEPTRWTEPTTHAPVIIEEDTHVTDLATIPTLPVLPPEAFIETHELIEEVEENRTTPLEIPPIYDSEYYVSYEFLVSPPPKRKDRKRVKRKRHHHHRHDKHVFLRHGSVQSVENSRDDYNGHNDAVVTPINTYDKQNADEYNAEYYDTGIQN